MSAELNLRCRQIVEESLGLDITWHSLPNIPHM